MKKKSMLPILGNVDWANVKPSTYVRYILMFVAVVNLVLNFFGVNPIPVDEDRLLEFVSTALPVVMLVINTYFDNPTSSEAIKSHEYMLRLKNGNTTDTDEE